LEYNISAERFEINSIIFSAVFFFKAKNY